MFERIIEIIVYVMGELKQNKRIAEIDTKQLVNMGFSNSEISTAFSWLVDKIEFGTDLFKNEQFSNPEAFRVLHSVEKDLFDDESWGLLIQMNSLGLLTNFHIEHIIEKALLLGIPKIDKFHLRFFVATVVFNAQQSTAGNRFMLLGNEIIN